MIALLAEDAPKPVRIGVLAKRGREHCLAKWSPTADYLTKRISAHAFMVVPLGFHEVYPVVESGKVDFILADPAHYVALEHEYAAERIATLKNMRMGKSYTVYAGVILTRADRKDIEHLADLKGKAFMAADERSFGGWLVVWRELKEKGVDPYRDFADLRFGGTQDAVVLAVRDGKVDAGSVRSDTLERMATEGRIRLDDFRVLGKDSDYDPDTHEVPFLHSTSHYPGWPFAKAGDTSDELAAKVAIALINMPPDCPAAKAAWCAGWTIPRNYQSVHECLKAIRVRPYQNYGKVTARAMFRQYWPWFLAAAALTVLIAFFAVYVWRLNARLRTAVVARESELSERKRAEDALRESEARFRGMFNHMSSGVAVYEAVDHGEDFVLVDFNPSGERSSKRSKEEVVGKRVTEAFPGVEEFGLLEVLRRVWRTGKGEHFPITFYQDEQVAGWRENFVYRLPSGEVVAIYDDVTERMRAQEALRASEQQYRSIFNISADAVMILRTDGVIVAANPAACEMYGYSEDELIGLTGRDIVHPDYHYKFEQFKRQLQSKSWFQAEAVDVRKDGTTFDSEVRGSSFEHEGKLHLLAIVRNITPRKRAEQERLSLERQVQQAQKLESLGVLAGGIAHDFNNLLTPIMGNADLVLKDLSPHAPARECIEEILKASRRAAELARQMLAYSSKGKFVIQPIRLNELVEEMTHLLEVAISKKAVLKCNFGQDIPFFDGDATEVRQIIMNLITNASEAIGEQSGIIALSTGAMHCDRACLDDVDDIVHASFSEPLPEGLYVYVEVADTGCGMDAETQAKVFDPFFTTKFTGRGLGMAAVLGIVRGHRGSIKIHSQVGRGATFRVLFPASREPAAILEEKLEDDADAEAFRGEGTVLVADDEDTVRGVCKQMLKRAGFNVLTAADGREALEVFREHADEIVCVLLDLTMPHLSGEEAFRELRRIRPDVKVVLCSGYSEQQATRSLAVEGWAGFIQKPYALANLMSTLKRAL